MAQRRTTSEGNRESWPVTLAEARSICRIASDVTAHDSDLQNLFIPTATRWCERHQCRVYTPTQFTDYFDDWPWCTRELELKWSPVNDSADVAISYYQASDDAATSWSSDNWMLDSSSCPPVIVPYSTASFPALSSVRPRNRVYVTYTAGYEDDGHLMDQNPQGKQAVLMLLGHLWKLGRDAVAQGNYGEIPFGIRAMLGQQRVLRA